MPHNTRRHLLRASAVAALLAGLGTRASAQTLDVVKIITGFPPGGTSDTISAE
jgi:tripartite-type tricarboxylate transporter receptor subunit TctC